ncbi:MAG: TIR domain-containing protein [Metamycoplasmataceae bacterium]
MSKITCFISYSHDKQNISKFKKINSLVANSNYYVNYSENKNKSNFSNDTIWNYLIKRIKGSSCTILLLTRDLLNNNKSKIEYKDNDFINSGWIYNEISASLRDWEDNKINGIVCVIEDSLIDSNNTIKYKLPEILDKNWKYIVFVSYSDFIENHTHFIEEALKNRKEQINSNRNKFKINYELHKR